MFRRTPLRLKPRRHHFEQKISALPPNSGHWLERSVRQLSAANREHRVTQRLGLDKSAGCNSLKSHIRERER
jgi:hypothetical protein